MKKEVRKCNTKIKKRIDEDTEKDIQTTEPEATEETTIEDITPDDVPDDVVEADETPIDEDVPVEMVDDDTVDVPDEDEEPEERADEQPAMDDTEETPVEPIEEENIIEGYAIVFNELSEDLGGFVEIITPEAVTEELISSSDIYYLFNHSDKSIPLARSKYGEGSLKLSIDNKGLKYSFNCLNSEFYNIVKRGDLDKSSFAFSLPADGNGEVWEKSNEYNYIRKITKIEKLYDCSAVLVPAYSNTSVYARSNNSIKEVDENYYNVYDNIIASLLH